MKVRAFQIEHELNLEVFQFLYVNGYACKKNVDTTYSDVVMEYSIDFLNGTCRGHIVLDDEGKEIFKNIIYKWLLEEPKPLKPVSNEVIM